MSDYLQMSQEAMACGHLFSQSEISNAFSEISNLMSHFLFSPIHFKSIPLKSSAKKEAIWHYAELFSGISKYILDLVEITLHYFAVAKPRCACSSIGGHVSKWARSRSSMSEPLSEGGVKMSV